MRRVSQGAFGLKPLLGESRAKLHRAEFGVSIPDCKACRLAIYQTAIKVDGVEQAQFDRARSRLIVWLDPAKQDLQPLRDAFTKARIELTP